LALYFVAFGGYVINFFRVYDVLLCYGPLFNPNNRKEI